MNNKEMKELQKSISNIIWKLPYEENYRKMLFNIDYAVGAVIQETIKAMESNTTESRADVDKLVDEIKTMRHGLYTNGITSIDYPFIIKHILSQSPKSSEEWVDVKDRLPDTFEFGECIPVFVYQSTVNRVVSDTYDDSFSYTDVTKWMYAFNNLPTPPTTKTTED